jgi:hypothetical protein
MRRALLVLALVGLAGCTGVDAPCLPWDDGCTMAALAAEEAMAPDWDAATVSRVGCENAAALMGGGDPDRCWDVRLEQDARPGETAEVLVVEMTDGSLATVTTEITDR